MFASASSDTTKAPPSEAAGYAYFVLLTLSILNLLNYTDRFIFAALIPYIQSDTGFSDAEMGRIGGAFTIVYTVLSPTFGYLGDRYHRGRLIAFGIAVWSVATAGAGFSKTFTQMLVTRSAVGIGEANYATIAPGLLSDYFVKTRRGLAMSIFTAAIPLGTAVGYLMGGFFGSPERLGWRHTLYLVGLPGLVAALVMFGIREPERGALDDPSPETETGTSGSVGFVESYKVLFKNGGYILACLGYAAVTFAVGALVFWAPKWLTVDKGLSVEHSNTVLGLCVVVAGFGGTIIGGIIGDKLSSRIRGAYLWVCSVSIGLSIIPTLIAIASPTQMVYVVSIFIAVFLIFLGNGPVNALLVNIVPANVRTTALGLVIVIIHFLGDGISQPLVGEISTRIERTVQAGGQLPGYVTSFAHLLHLNPQTQTLSVALLLMPLALLLSAALYAAGLKTRAGREN